MKSKRQTHQEMREAKCRNDYKVAYPHYIRIAVRERLICISPAAVSSSDLGVGQPCVRSWVVIPGHGGCVSDGVQMEGRPHVRDFAQIKDLRVVRIILQPSKRLKAQLLFRNGLFTANMFMAWVPGIFVSRVRKRLVAKPTLSRMLSRKRLELLFYQNFPKSNYLTVGR